MKKFVFNLLMFILSFVILVIVPIIIICKFDNKDRNSSNNQNIITLQTKSNYDSLDILFVGNSYCYSSINIKHFDSIKVSAFNLGVSTSGIKFYDLIINDYFQHVKFPPKKVLILLSPMTFSSASDNFTLYPIHRYLESPKSNIEVALKNKDLTEVISMYKKSFTKALSNIFIKNTKDKNKVLANNKGFVPSDKISNEKEMLQDKHLYIPLLKDNFDKTKVSKLIKLAYSIEAKGSKVMFFELPTYKLNNYFNKKYLADYRNGLIQIEKKYEILSVDSNLFISKNYRNLDHMNSSGANIATNEIIRLLNLKRL